MPGGKAWSNRQSGRCERVGEQPGAAWGGPERVFILFGGSWGTPEGSESGQWHDQRCSFKGYAGHHKEIGQEVGEGVGKPASCRSPSFSTSPLGAAPSSTHMSLPSFFF